MIGVREIDDVLAAVRARVSGAEVSRLAVTHSADDDNVWLIRSSDGGVEVQIDSHPDGKPPFYLETDHHGQITATTAREAAAIIEGWLLTGQ